MASEQEASIALHLQAGELGEAATAAILAYGSQVLGYLAAVLRSEADAAEAFSAFAERLWRGIRGFRGQSSFRTWVYRVAWSAAQDVVRDPFRRRGRRLQTVEAAGIPAPALSAPEPWQRASSPDALERLRARLRPEEQTLLALRVGRGFSWREVAQVLAAPGVAPPSEAALRKRFEWLKGKLRRMAQEEGLLG